MKRLAILLLLLAATAHAQTTTRLQIVNARAGEIYPIPTTDTRPEVLAQNKISFQGNAVEGWQTKIAAIRIDRIYPWTTSPQRYGFSKTETIATCPLETDGSVLCILPCNITYQLRGVDSAGAVVAEDNTLHTAICGEAVSCHGCHDAHSQERITELGKTALERWPTTIAGKKPVPPGC